MRTDTTINPGAGHSGKGIRLRLYHRGNTKVISEEHLVMLYPAGQIVGLGFFVCLFWAVVLKL